jgi:hypothetical protein
MIPGAGHAVTGFDPSPATMVQALSGQKAQFLGHFQQRLH